MNGHVFKKLPDCNWIHYKQGGKLLHWFDKIQLTQEQVLQLINLKKRLNYKISDTKVSTFDANNEKDIEFEGEWKPILESIFILVRLF